MYICAKIPNHWLYFWTLALKRWRLLHRKQPLSLSYFYLKAWGKQTPPIGLVRKDLMMTILFSTSCQREYSPSSPSRARIRVRRRCKSEPYALSLLPQQGGWPSFLAASRFTYAPAALQSSVPSRLSCFHRSVSLFICREATCSASNYSSNIRRNCPGGTPFTAWPSRL